MNKEEIFKQFIYTLEDDIKNKTFLTYQEKNEWKDYLERIINSQTNKYKIVLDKIKEKLKEKDENGFEKIYVEDAIIFIDELLESF